MSFVGGFGSGLSSGISSGMQFSNALHQAKLWQAQQAQADAYSQAADAGQQDQDQQAALPPVQPLLDAERSFGGSGGSSGSGQTYQDAPADLSTVPHPQAVGAAPRQAIPGSSPNVMPPDPQRADQDVTGQSNPLSNSTPSATAADAPKPQQTSPTGSAVGQAATSPAALYGGQQGQMGAPPPTRDYAPVSTASSTSGARTEPSTAPSNMATYDTPPGGYSSGAALGSSPDELARAQRSYGPEPVNRTPSATAAEAPVPGSTPAPRPEPTGAPVASALPTPSATAAEAPRAGATQAANPAQPPGSAPAPVAAAPAPAAPVPLNPPLEAQAAPQKSLGAKILGAINPVSSAQAAEPVPGKSAAAPAAPASEAIPTAPASAASPTTGVSATPDEHTAPIEKGMPPPARITLPVTSKPVVPDQATPTVQSEPTPDQSKGRGAEARHFPINPQAMTWLEKNRPEDAKLVQQIADKNGISPERLAAHWWQESRLVRNAKDGAAGEKGVMQVMPGTQAEVDPHLQLDPTDYKQSLEMGARYIRSNDDLFGRDTVSSVMAYNGGPGAANEAASGQNTPRVKNVTRYASSPVFFGGKEIGPSDLTTQAHFDVGAAEQAAAQNGPSGLLHYIANTQPKNMTLGAKWQAFENAAVRYQLMRGGSPQEIQATQDWVSQQAQKGANQALMGAHKAMVLGDNFTAAQYLARAHAFFPDGTVGKFGVDDKGQLWASRVDEGDPSKQLGQPNRVTVDQVQMMMAQSTDTRSYLKMVQEQQKVASELKFQADRGDYYRSVAGTRQERIQTNNQNFQLRLAEQQNVHQAQEADRDQRRQLAVQKMADAEGAQQEKQAAAREKGLASVEKYWGQSAIDTGSGEGNTALTPDQKGLGSMVHRAVRSGDPEITDPEAYRIGLGVATGKLTVLPVRSTDGSIKYGVYDKSNPHAGSQAVLDGPDGQRLAARLAPVGQTAVRNAGLGAINPNSSRMPSRAETGAPITPIPASTPMASQMPSQAIH